MIPQIPEEAKHYFRDCDLKKFNAIVWDFEDWKIFYECIGFAMFKIMRRNRTKQTQEIDYQI